MTLLIKTQDSHPHGQKDSPPNSEERQLDLKLVWGTSAPALDGIASYLSPDGRKAYLVYVNNGEATPWLNTQPVAEIRTQNQNHELVVTSTLPYDSFYNSQFPYVAIGAASKDFTRFSVLAGGGPIVDEGEIGLMRIQVLDANLNVLGSRIINDINFNDLSGGTFSEDNKYLSFAYSFPAPAPSLSYNTYMYILDARDPNLKTVCGPVVIEGSDPIFPGLEVFTLYKKCKKRYYFTFANSQFNSDTNEFQPPYYSQVYSFNPKKHSIKLVSSKRIPQFAEGTVYVSDDKKHALVCHGGQCTVNPNAPNIYTVITEDMIGTTPPNFNSVIIFKFDVCNQELKPILEQESECCSFIMVWPPSKGTKFFLAQSTTIFATPGDPSELVPAPQEYYSTFQTVENEKGQLSLRPMNGPFQDLKRGWSTFSQNGKWLLRTGQFGYLNDDPTMPTTDSIGIKNILLLKISEHTYQPINDIFCK